MLAQLPAEIWVHIASYLPDVQLRKLYYLNHLFYQLAADSLYRTVDIADTLQITNRTVARLRSASVPALATRIRSLVIDFTLFRDLNPRRSAVVLAMNSTTRWVREVMQRPKRKPLVLKTSKSARELYKVLLDVAKGAENVQHIGFNVQTRHPIAPDIQWVGDIWSLISGRARSLSLALTGDELEPILQIFGDLSRLKHLSVDLHQGFTSWDESRSRCLAKLFNLASANLENFSLTMDSSQASSAFRTFFHKLGHFPQLKHVVLYIVFDELTGASIVQLLNAHGESIEKLHLVPQVDAPTGLQSLSSLHLPKLRNLSLDLRFLRVDQHRTFWDGALSFPALTDLNIINPGSQYIVATFCQSFEKFAFASSLRTLHLDIAVVSRNTFNSLSTACPQLHSLTIRARSLCRAFKVGQVWNWNISSFARGMAGRRYHNWQLSDLTVIRESDDQETQIQWPVMRIVAACTPSIKSFCGNGHMGGPSTTRGVSSTGARIEQLAAIQILEHPATRTTSSAWPRRRLPSDPEPDSLVHYHIEK